ncbi:MAG TPA: branched-chain amino acid ABC transporter permease [Magnetospirillaceae bacterium]|jgi:branched-chain amino acid transport system permease protein
MEWVDVVLQGALLGGLYALFASGLSLAFGIMRMVNLAHGDFIVLSAYLALVLTQSLGIPPLAALPAVAVIMAVVGYVLQRGLLNRVLGDDIMPPLLVTFGLSVVIQNLLQEIFSADTQSLPGGTLVTASLPIGGGLAVGWLSLLTLVAALAVIAVLQLILARTRLGLAFRATSDDLVTSRLMGIDTRQIYGLAMGIALAIVAIAGVLMAIRTTFDPTGGPARLIFAFESVIIGGMGSPWGTLLGGVILGVAQSIGFSIQVGLGQLFGHLAFLAILMVRPQGLFPRTRGV